MAEGESGRGGQAPFRPHLSSVAQSVVRNPIRTVALKQQATPGCISLAGGRPPVDVFPEAVKKWGDETFTNYGPHLAVGVPELRAWARDFVGATHAPPGGFDGRDVLITSGNTDGITKAVMLLTDPGDVVLADEVTYPAIMAVSVPLGRRVVGVPLDGEGMNPDRLEAALAGLGAAKARLLYLVPHGQNPTGITMPESRKDAIYEVARRHDLCILEDDPYFFLRLTPSSPELPLEEGNMVGSRTPPRGFLSRDVDGRVVRLDSVSKVIAPGFRIGWVTGASAVLAKWATLAEIFTWSVSGVQQRALLDIVRGWGQEGLHGHLQKLQLTYARRRSYLLAACEKHLEGLCKWSAPEFGMFFWLEVLGCEDTGKTVEELIGSYGVAMVPGASFATPEGASDAPRRFFRVSFSGLDEEKSDRAMLQLQRFLRASSLPKAEGRKRPAEEAAERAREPHPRLEAGAAAAPLVAAAIA